jgi:alpha-tubulin suppressor-like RCC1 family protein
MSYHDITVGASSVVQGDGFQGNGGGAGQTLICTESAAAYDGVITSADIWIASTESNVVIATLYGSSNSWTPRGYATIASVTGGSKQTITGLSIPVHAGDLVGIFTVNSSISCNNTGGTGFFYSSADTLILGYATAYNSSLATRKLLIKLYGVTLPDAPTGVNATDNLPHKVTITWTPGTGETGGNHVYRDATDLGLVAHGTSTLDDTGGVVGTVYSYTVKAVNAAGLSAASVADNGQSINNPPTVTTSAATSISWNNCLANGNVTSIGDVPLTQRGFCYMVGTGGDPTTANSTVYDTTSSTGAYSLGISGLSANTGYRVRSYAINSAGTSYGSTVQVTTANRETELAQRIVEIDFMEYPTDVLAQAAYASSALALAYSWGVNSYGELGTGNTTSYSIPASISSTINWSAITCGFGHAAALNKTNGLAYSWGYNNVGQLGINSTTNASTPQSVSSATSWKSIQAGYNFTIAINGANGLAYAWGASDYGELGNNTRTNSSIPVSVSSATSWTMISTTPSSDTVMAINGANGLLYGWGYNAYGNIGNNSTTSYSVPTSVSSATSWKFVSCGGFHTVAIAGSNGLAYAWGLNNYGQLGTGNRTNYSIPTSVSSTISWAAVACGIYYTVAIAGSNGLAYAWGDNTYGQLGNNSTTSYSVPTSVSSATSWKSIQAGDYHAMTVQGSNGLVYGWGQNTSGELGNNTRTNCSVPTSVSLGINLTAVACGTSFTEVFSLSNLWCYSEGTIISQGLYSLKAIASSNVTGQTLIRTLSGLGNVVDLTGVNTITFDIYSSRTGSNIQVSIVSGSTTTSITPNVTGANAWQTVSWDISAVADVNKNNVTQIIITMVESSSANTFYVDNFKIPTSSSAGTDIFGIVG